MEKQRLRRCFWERVRNSTKHSKPGDSNFSSIRLWSLKGEFLDDFSGSDLYEVEMSESTKIPNNSRNFKSIGRDRSGEKWYQK